MYPLNVSGLAEGLASHRAGGGGKEGGEEEGRGATGVGIISTTEDSLSGAYCQRATR